MELIAKINAFVATPNEKSVKIDVSNSRFGRLRDLSESCPARQPALPAGAEATSRVVFLAGTDTADKDGTSKRTTAIAIFGMTKDHHDRYVQLYGQLPALLDFILSLPKELWFFVYIDTASSRCTAVPSTSALHRRGQMPSQYQYPVINAASSPSRRYTKADLHIALFPKGTRLLSLMAVSTLKFVDMLGSFATTPFVLPESMKSKCIATMSLHILLLHHFIF